MEHPLIAVSKRAFSSFVPECSGLAEFVRPGFRRRRRAINNVLVLRALIDEARRMHRPLYVVYLNLSKRLLRSVGAAASGVSRGRGHERGPMRALE